VSLFWLSYRGNEDVRVVIQPATSLVIARMKTALAEIGERNFQDGHELDANMATRVPGNMIGRCLSAEEALELLNRLAP
jgi:hypothetical protein